MGQITGMRSGLACTGIALGLAVLLVAPPASAQQVLIQNSAFNPQMIEIEVGETVTWVHQDAVMHTTTSDPGQTESWDSGDMTNGQTFQHTFNEPGTFTYHCIPHQGFMFGSVVVSPVTFTVSTSVSGPGSINPTSAQVEAGETAEFTLFPASGASIDSASGCGGNLSGNLYTTGPINGDCTVFASFSFDTYTVSTSVTGPGSIDPVSAVVEHGQSTEFTLIPDAGAGIDSVTGCGGSLNGDTYTTGPITGACTVSASFSINTYTVGSSVTGPGSIDPESAVVEHGQSTEFTLTPNAGASIDSASGCGGSLVGDTYTTGPITGACTVSASFSLDTYTVSTIVTGPGSIAPESAIVEHGASAEFSLNPNPGAAIDSASGCDGSLAGNTYTTGPITADCTVSADFVVDKNLIFWDRFEAGQPFGLPLH